MEPNKNTRSPIPSPRLDLINVTECHVPLRELPYPYPYGWVQRARLRPHNQIAHNLLYGHQSTKDDFRAIQAPTSPPAATQTP
jgi:hypothetical protein